jgi:hypothetical protein
MVYGKNGRFATTLNGNTALGWTGKRGYELVSQSMKWRYATAFNGRVGLRWVETCGYELMVRK